MYIFIVHNVMDMIIKDIYFLLCMKYFNQSYYHLCLLVSSTISIADYVLIVYQQHDGNHYWNRNCLYPRSTLVHHLFIVRVAESQVFCVQQFFADHSFSFFFQVIVLSVLPLRLMASDYPFGIFKYFVIIINIYAGALVYYYQQLSHV